MKKIKEIEADLEGIQAKLDLGASDWTKEEKEHIEKCYFAITKESVGRGRTVDVGCQECVQSAVNVIKNYQALVLQDESDENKPKVKVVKMVSNTEADWRDTLKTIQEKADELNFTFTKKERTKDQRIAALETYMGNQEVKTEEVHDLLGELDDYKADQLVAIIKAKTGESLDPDEYTLEELLGKIKEIEDEDTDE